MRNDRLFNTGAAAAASLGKLAAEGILGQARAAQAAAQARDSERLRGRRAAVQAAAAAAGGQNIDGRGAATGLGPPGGGGAPWRRGGPHHCIAAKIPPAHAAILGALPVVRRIAILQESPGDPPDNLRAAASI